jgi:hypothetical protein
MPVDEVLDHRRQRVARLRVRGGDDQAAGIAAGVLLADARMFSASRSMRSAISSTALPGSVIAVRRLPPRSKTVTPSSSSSSLICLEIPGCEVYSASAASETLRPRRATSTR